MKYFIYIRKSTDDKAKQIQSIPDQKRILNALARERNLEVLDTIIDEKSAKSPGRVGFSEMVERIQNGEASGIICWKMDRLARNTIDGGTLTWMLQTEKIEEIITPEKTFLPDENTLILSIEFGMATQFSRDLRKSVNRGMDSKIDKGWYASRAPIGYLNDKHAVKGEKTILCDPDTFPQIKYLWGYLLKHECNLMDLYRHMKEYSPIYRNGKLVAFSTFDRMFKSEFYCGLFWWRGELKIGAHKPMITQAQFDKVQDILTKKKKSTRQASNGFEFKGLFKCGCCDAFITAEEKIKYVKSTQKETKYRYYRCVHRKRDRTCTEKPITESLVFETIQKELEGVYLPPQLIAFYLKKIQSLESDAKQSVKEAQIKKELQTISKKIETLKNNLCDEPDQDIRDIMKSRLTEVKVMQKRLKEDLVTEISKNKNPHHELKTSLEVLTKAKQILKSGTKEQKNNILKNLGSNWTVEAQTLSYKANRVTKALKKTQKFLLGEKAIIELNKKQSETALSADLNQLDEIWSAWRESNPLPRLGRPE